MPPSGRASFLIFDLLSFDPLIFRFLFCPRKLGAVQRGAQNYTIVFMHQATLGAVKTYPLNIGYLSLAGGDGLAIGKRQKVHDLFIHAGGGTVVYRFAESGGYLDPDRGLLKDLALGGHQLGLPHLNVTLGKGAIAAVPLTDH